MTLLEAEATTTSAVGLEVTPAQQAEEELRVVLGEPSLEHCNAVLAQMYRKPVGEQEYLGRVVVVKWSEPTEAGVSVRSRDIDPGQGLSQTTFEYLTELALRNWHLQPTTRIHRYYAV